MSAHRSHTGNGQLVVRVLSDSALVPQPKVCGRNQQKFPQKDRYNQTECSFPSSDLQIFLLLLLLWPRPHGDAFAHVLHRQVRSPNGFCKVTILKPGLGVKHIESAALSLTDQVVIAPSPLVLQPSTSSPATSHNNNNNVHSELVGIKPWRFFFFVYLKRLKVSRSPQISSADKVLLLHCLFLSVVGEFKVPSTGREYELHLWSLSFLHIMGPSDILDLCSCYWRLWSESLTCSRSFLSGHHRRRLLLPLAS